jgi:hypothetical protein
VPLSILLELGENCSCCIARGISLHSEASRLRQEYQDRHRGDEAFQLKEGITLCISPLEGGVLPSQIIQGSGNLGEILDEPSIEIYESQE